MKLLKNITIFLLAAVLLAASAAGNEPIDVNAEAALTIHYAPAAGTEFRLYRAADISADAHFTFTGDFASYPVSAENLDADGWRTLAGTLAGYVQRDELTPLETGTVDDGGYCSFGVMAPGLYLVLGESVSVGDYTYTPEPFLVSLPDADEYGSWVYDVTAEVKYTSRYDSGEPDDGATSRKVLKVWNDEGNESLRPEEIEVSLLQDGKVYDTILLTKENGWRYTWNGLSEKSQWTVVETEVPGYTVAVRSEGAAFVVTNTYVTDVPDNPDNPDTPDSPDNPDNPGNPDTPDTPDNPDEPGEPDSPDGPPEPSEPSNPGEPKLPQTGVLWWPVPVLASAGLLFIIIGLIRRRRYNGE